MSYRCPICGKITSTPMNLARHMMVVVDRLEEHVEWIEKKGFSYPALVGLKQGRLGKGRYKDLAELLEREAKI